MLLVALAVALPIVRSLAADWLRRTIEARLEEISGAEVEVGAVALGWQRLVVERVELRRFSGAPWLSALDVDALVVEGSPLELWCGEIRSLGVERPRIELVASCRAASFTDLELPRAGAPQQALPVALSDGRLEILGPRARNGSGQNDSGAPDLANVEPGPLMLGFEGELVLDESGIVGQLRGSGERVDLTPLLGLAAPSSLERCGPELPGLSILESAQTHLTVDLEPLELRLDGRASQVMLTGPLSGETPTGRSLDLGETGLVARLELPVADAPRLSGALRTALGSFDLTTEPSVPESDQPGSHDSPSWVSYRIHGETERATDWLRPWLVSPVELRGPLILEATLEDGHLARLGLDAGALEAESSDSGSEAAGALEDLTFRQVALSLVPGEREGSFSVALGGTVASRERGMELAVKSRDLTWTGDAAIDGRLDVKLRSTGQVQGRAQPPLLVEIAGRIDAAAGRLDLEAQSRVGGGLDDLVPMLERAAAGRQDLLERLAQVHEAGARSGELELRARVSGRRPNMAGHATIEVPWLELDLAGGPSAGQSRSVLRVEGLSVALDSTDLARWAGLRARAQATTSLASALGPFDLRLAGDARGHRVADDPLGAVEVDLSAESEMDGSARLELTGARDPSSTSSSSSFSWLGTLELDGVSLERVRERVLEAYGERIDPEIAGVSVTGALGASFEGEWQGGKRLVSGVIEGTDLGGSSSAGDRVLAGWSPRLEVAAEWPPDSALEVQGKGALGGFEILWGTLYGDLRSVSTPFTVDLERSVSATGEARWRALGELLGRTVHLELKAELGESREASPASAQLRLSVPDLESFRQAFLVPTFGAGRALLSDSRVAGDLQASVNLRLDSEAGLGAQAELALNGVAFDTPNLHLEGLDFSLPLRPVAIGSGDTGGCRFTAVEASSALADLGGADLRLDHQRSGHLRLTGARLGSDDQSIELGALESPLVVDSDSVAFERPVTIPLLGGTLELDRLGVHGLWCGEPLLQARARLRDLEVERLTERLGMPAFRGRLEADVERLTLDRRGDLVMDGGGTSRVLGGQVELSQLGVRNLFSDFPRVELSLSFRDLDLLELSSAFTFGEVSGRAKGEIEQLVLIGGSPVTFQARLQTQAEAKDRRRISLRAVDSFTSLAAGAETSSSSGSALPKLFSRFPYQAIGVDVALEDDRFVMRGLEHRGSNELFVKGKLPLRLDVVNVRPGTTVSFRTMMSRLRNLKIERGRAASAPNANSQGAPP